MTLVADLLYRLIGSAGGSAIALAIAQPRSRNGLAQRIVVSITSGLMFAPVWIYYLEWPMTRDNVIAASCVTAAIAWGAWHTLIRAVQAWPGFPAFPRKRE